MRNCKPRPIRGTIDAVEPAKALPEQEPQTESARRASGRLSLGLKLSYGMPSFAGAAMAVPIAVHMTKFYSDTVGVALGFIALAQALARAFDAITDPLMGWISDRTRTRWGRRRPYIAIGAPVSAIFFVGLFAPPESLDSLAAAGWFTVMIFGFFVLHTIYGIPHYGLGAELTSDYHERNSLFAYREFCILAGTMVAAAVPSIVVSRLKAGGVEQALAERQVYFWLAAVMSTLVVLLYWWLCYRVPENPEYYSRKPNPLVPGVRRVLRNRPFRILLLCYLITSVTGAIPGIFLPFYLQYVLGLENWLELLGGMLLVYFGSGMLSVPLFWLRLARRWGKRNAWLLHYVLGMTASLSLFAIPSIWPGAAGILPVYVVLLWAGTAFGSGFVLAPSMQADVIDYDELYTGRRREAQYGALWAIVFKFALIPSVSIPLAILASVGFEPNVEQTETVKWTIRAIYGIAPATMQLAAMCIAFLYPISHDVHAAVLAGIEAHRNREPARDPLTGRTLPPPEDRGLDEETGWFLDHFSPGELSRALRRGRGALVRDAWLWLGISALVCVGFTLYTVWGLGDLSEQPGPAVVLSVMVAGIGLTGICFHAIRLRASRRARSVSDQEIRAHVEVGRLLSQRR
jgi:GPH family glycoside/pentoside/hexuronide:cation symporter